jgi:uncharacterized protein YaaQ
MSPGNVVDLLVLLSVSGRQSSELIAQLIREKFYFTRIDSSGGLVQEPTNTLLIGLAHTRADRLFQIVEEYCKPYREYIPVNINLHQGVPPLSMVEAQVGGALVYTMNVERFEQL